MLSFGYPHLWNKLGRDFVAVPSLTILEFVYPVLHQNKSKPPTMKTAIIASLIASAAAFAPAQQKSSSTALNMAFEDALGAQAPLGFWDPLGLVADGDQEKFDRLRYVEIKHGRICMLGVVGYLVNKAGIYLPGDISFGTPFSSLGSGWDASFAVPVAGALQVFAFVGFLELFVMKDIEGTGNEFVGDFRNGFIDFGWDSFDEETKLQKRAIELNQGRAAQMGLLGLMVHDQLGNVDTLIPN